MCIGAAPPPHRLRNPQRSCICTHGHPKARAAHLTAYASRGLRCMLPLCTPLRTHPPAGKAAKRRSVPHVRGSHPCHPHAALEQRTGVGELPWREQGRMPLPEGKSWHRMSQGWPCTDPHLPYLCGQLFLDTGPAMTHTYQARVNSCSSRLALH